MTSDDPLLALGVEGPVQLEVFVLWLDGGAIALTGPCGPAPWHIETGGGEHPVDVVRRLVTDVIGEPWPGRGRRRLRPPSPPIRSSSTPSATSPGWRETTRSCGPVSRPIGMPP